MIYMCLANRNPNRSQISGPGIAWRQPHAPNEAGPDLRGCLGYSPRARKAPACLIVAEGLMAADGIELSPLNWAAKLLGNKPAARPKAGAKRGVTWDNCDLNPQRHLACPFPPTAWPAAPTPSTRPVIPQNP